MKYRKKPVVIEAIVWEPDLDGVNMNAWPTYWDAGPWELEKSGHSFNLIIPTLEGNHAARPGDYIIRGVAGEFYPCKPDIFEKTYELVEEPK